MSFNIRENWQDEKINTVGISIIIPVYNAGQYFEACLQSICTSSRRDFEVIIIDDGSTDGSGQLAQKMADADLRVYYYWQENQGVSAARNHGMELAQGKWIMFVDADDTMEPDTLETLSQLEPEYADADIVCFDCKGYPQQPVCQTMTREIVEDMALEANGIRQGELHGTLASMQWKLYRNDFLQRSGLKVDQELVRGEDLLFNCYAYSAARKVAFSGYNYYFYRDNAQSATRRRNPAVKDLDETFQIKLRAYAQQFGYHKLGTAGCTFTALNGILVCYYAYFAYFHLWEYGSYRRELKEFLQKQVYISAMEQESLCEQYLGKRVKLLLTFLKQKWYFMAYLIFGVGRREIRRWRKR